MEVQDGFIAGIYDYCDRWCETCAFTSHCRVFGDAAESPAAPSPPRWLKECIDEMNDTKLDPGHQAIEDRAREYAHAAAGWLQIAGAAPDRDPADPRSVVAHYCVLIAAKIHRALAGLGNGLGPGEPRLAGHEGSCKVALMAIDRSRIAWLEAVRRGLADIGAVRPFVSTLGRLADDLERIIPNARAFVRPGFDD